MTLPAATYDLVMLLDPEAEEATRAKLVADARAAIEAQGVVLRHDDWGNRALSYPIERRNVAEYHLLQFHVHTPALLSTLDRSLRIADEILRFRIIKLKPGVPDAPDMLAAPSAPRRAEPGADGASGGPAAHLPPQAQAPDEPRPAPAPDEPRPAPAPGEPRPAPAPEAAPESPEPAAESPEAAPESPEPAAESPEPAAAAPEPAAEASEPAAESPEPAAEAPEPAAEAPEPEA
jgi:small subunit ribosomal protein S6